jgi:hypothetical protein
LTPDALRLQHLPIADCARYDSLRAKAGELRLAGISSITAANAWLPGFIAAYNTRFGRDPANAKDLHWPLAQADDLDAQILNLYVG